MDANINIEFIQWLNKKSKLYHRFNELALLFEEFLTEIVLVSRERAEAVSNRFSEMLGQCNIPNIYENDQAAQTYAMLHFLQRYRRFQIVFLHIIEKNLLPTNHLIAHLDIGTGPAPLIFALSDIVKYFKEFCIESQYNDLVEIEYSPDYVESSNNFRNWLHHFTEFVNYKNAGGGWSVPYHHGSFTEFETLDFKKLNYNKPQWQKERIYEEFGSNPKYLIQELHNEINVYGKNFMSGVMYDNRRNAHRYDILSFSYFLTQIGQVRKYKRQIQGCVFSLKNNGILINIGATSAEYSKIAAFLRDNIHKYSSRNGKLLISCKEVCDECLSVNNHDMYDKRIKQSYDFILDKLDSFEVQGSIPAKIYKILSDYINSGKDDNSRGFRLQVFQKRITAI